MSATGYRHHSEPSGYQQVPHSMLIIDRHEQFRTRLTPGRIAIACGLWLISAGTLMAGEPDIGAGQKLFAVCQGCHGEHAEGSPVSNAPRLAGQHDWYLLRQLRNFRADLRGAHPDDAYGQLMNGMAKTLPDEQALSNVVAYIGTLKAAAPETTLSSGNPAAGAKTFFYCQSCHGPEGTGNEDPGAPRLAGQHDWYLVRQLQNFRADIRGTAEEDSYGQSMHRIAQMMLTDDQAVDDVVAYIQTL